MRKMNSKSAKLFLSSRRKFGVEEEEKEKMHMRFLKFLRQGKAIFNILKAAAWRREAYAKMDDLVKQEKRLSEALIPAWVLKKRGPAVVAPAVVAAPVEKQAQEEPQTREEAPVVAEDDKESRLPRVGATAFRSHAMGRQEPLNELRLDLTRAKPVARGKCYLASRAMAHDERLGGWRFLVPGLSVLRLDFTVHISRTLVLTLTDFLSDATTPCLIDVSLNGTSLRFHERDSLPVGNLLCATNNRLEVGLSSDAAPYAYHLMGLSIAPPPPTAPNHNDLTRTTTLLATTNNHHPLPSHHHDELVKSYELGYRLRQKQDEKRKKKKNRHHHSHRQR